MDGFTYISPKRMMVLHCLSVHQKKLLFFTKTLVRTWRLILKHEALFIYMVHTKRISLMSDINFLFYFCIFYHNWKYMSKIYIARLCVEYLSREPESNRKSIVWKSRDRGQTEKKRTQIQQKICMQQIYN